MHALADLTPLLAEIPGTAAFILVAGVGLCWLFLYLSSKQDTKNFVYQRAPRLPIASLAEHDDAWLRGVVEHDAPLRCPHFGFYCVWYAYSIERKVTRTTTDSKGRTSTTTSWQTEYRDSASIDFLLRDESGGIGVEVENARFQHMPGTGHDYDGFSKRHSAKYLAVGREVTALGVKDESLFKPYREIPLILTTKTPEDYVKRGDRSEWWYRKIGYFWLFAGGLGASIAFYKHLRRDPDWVICALIGLGALIPLWFISTFNRMIRVREQCEAGLRQIDVDIDVRNRVIPQLVEVVKGYQKHERELFERIAELRNSRGGDLFSSEAQSRVVSQHLLALEEDYPDLRANENYMKLHDQLWALEEKIAASRSFYNKLANEWNDLVEGIPTVVVATVFRWGPRGHFAAAPAERARVSAVVTPESIGQS